MSTKKPKAPGGFPADPKSKRSLRRAKRGFTGKTKYEERAEKMMLSASAYSGHGTLLPGTENHKENLSGHYCYGGGCRKAHPN